MTQTLFITSAAVLVYMTVWFVIAQVKGRNDIVDVAWGPGFILAALVSLVVGGVYTSRGLLISLLVLMWGIRLAMHIHARNRGKGEDHRYRKWREEWGESVYLRSFLQVFMLQGVLLVIVAVPVIFVNASPPAPYSWLNLVGIAVWLTGFGFEAVGDWQLLRFIRDPANRGKLMTGGLWRYTRHPNYFGDAAQWWAYYLIALAAGGWWTIFSPIIMTTLLVRVSGAALLEKTMDKRPGYQEYIETTSAFVPWLPRRKR